MKQAALDLRLGVKKTRKREFLEQMERVVPWASLVAFIVLPRGSYRLAALCLGDDAAHAFPSVMVQPVGPDDGRCLL